MSRIPRKWPSSPGRASISLRVSAWTFSSTTIIGGTAAGTTGTGPMRTTGRGLPSDRGTFRRLSTGFPRTTAPSTSTRSPCRTASGRRCTGSTTGNTPESTKGTSTTTISLRPAAGSGQLLQPGRVLEPALGHLLQVAGPGQGGDEVLQQVGQERISVRHPDADGVEREGRLHGGQPFLLVAGGSDRAEVEIRDHHVRLVLQDQRDPLVVVDRRHELRHRQDLLDVRLAGGAFEGCHGVFRRVDSVRVLQGGDRLLLGEERLAGYVVGP